MNGIARRYDLGVMTHSCARPIASSPVSIGLPLILPQLWRFALALTRAQGHAEDLVQATCVRVLERAELFQAGTHLDRWAFTVMINLWRSEKRRDRPQVPIDESGDDALVAPIGECPERRTFHAQIIAAIAALPPDQSQTVSLVFGAGYSYKEAASRLDVPVGTVMSRLHSARRKLASLNAG